LEKDVIAYLLWVLDYDVKKWLISSEWNKDPKIDYKKSWSPSKEESYLTESDLDELENKALDWLLSFLKLEFSELIEWNNNFSYEDEKRKLNIVFSKEGHWFDLIWKAPVNPTTMAFWRSWLKLI